MLTVREAAALLSIPKGTLDLWRQEKKGPPFYRMGGRIRYKREDLEAWLEKQRVS